MTVRKEYLSSEGACDVGAEIVNSGEGVGAGQDGEFFPDGEVGAGVEGGGEFSWVDFLGAREFGISSGNPLNGVNGSSSSKNAFEPAKSNLNLFE